ncbi:MAG: hypothetical protein JXB04_04670 [Kiritimatiellae bacterium]|nr:hypothetical protein [Kiritimatiellia bacterium]
MTALVIKSLPVKIHRRLKEEASRHRRSMTQEAIAILEQGLFGARPIAAVKPFRGRFPLTSEFIDAAKREGRP